MKSILFNAYGDEGHARRLDATLDIVRAFDAHLTLVDAIPHDAAGSLDPYGFTFASMYPVWQEESKKLRAETEADLANEGVNFDWISTTGPVALALLRFSALSDLVIVGAKDPRPDGSAPSFTAGELAVTADCPVLVLPVDCSRIDPESPVVVAWDGSAEASHALRAAMPMLKRAKSVFLVTVEEGKRDRSEFDLPPVRGADYLARHGVACEIVEVKAGEGGTAHAIVDAAEVRGAGLIVMGAYGNRRLSERVFGGVTRKMLADVRLPLLMTH